MGEEQVYGKTGKTNKFRIERTTNPSVLTANIFVKFIKTALYKNNSNKKRIVIMKVSNVKPLNEIF